MVAESLDPFGVIWKLSIVKSQNCAISPFCKLSLLVIAISMGKLELALLLLLVAVVLLAWICDAVVLEVVWTLFEVVCKLECECKCSEDGVPALKVNKELKVISSGRASNIESNVVGWGK